MKAACTCPHLPRKTNNRDINLMTEIVEVWAEWQANRGRAKMHYLSHLFSRCGSCSSASFLLYHDMKHDSG